MYEVKLTAKYRRDYKRMMRRGYDLDKIEKVIDTLREGKSLPWRNRDHALEGNMAGMRECHILPDWLLIYTIKEQELVLVAFRTGTHEDLFG